MNCYRPNSADAGDPSLVSNQGDFRDSSTDDPTPDDPNPTSTYPDPTEDSGTITDSGHLPETSTVDACVPTPLACDGVAHACDGVIDKGCPSALAIAKASKFLNQLGDPRQSTLYTDSCPDGQAITGIFGTLATSGWISSLTAVCGTFSFQENTTTTPYSYSVTVGPGTTLSRHGTDSTGGPYSRLCPANQVVVAMSGRGGAYTDQIVLECAPLKISGTPKNFQVAYGTTTVLQGAGGTGGTAVDRSACPPDGVVRAIAGGQSSYLDAFQPNCAQATLLLR